MKHLKRSIFSLVVICAMLLSLAQTCLAVSISITAGQSTVSVGKTVAFTITVPSGSEAWTYSVSYSSNLSLESGDLSPLGFEGESRSNQLVFRAKSTGTATVRITAGSYCINGTNYDASGSASVTVVTANKPDSGESKPTPGASRSSNNALASLTVSMGELTPAFDPSITDYTLSLPLNTDALTVTATPSDSKATVQGDGEVILQGGENQVAVVVTAENGDTKTYTIVVKVAQAPSLFLLYSGQRLGVVKDTEEVVPPAGFTAADPLTIDGDTLPIWVDAAGEQTLIYLIDEETGAAGFYLYSQTSGVVLSPYIPLAGDYIYTGIPAELSAIPGLTPCTVEAFGSKLDGWKYDDPALSEFYVLYLMNTDGIYGYYTFDSSKGTLQRFSGAVFADSNDVLRVPLLYVYIAGGAAALLLILVIVFACVSGSRGKKLRLLSVPEQTPPNDEGAAPVLEEPLPTPEENTPPEQPEEPAAPPEPPQPEEPEPQSEPEQPEEPEPELPDSPESPVAEPEQPASKETTVPEKEPEKTPEQPSLEDTLRHLPLDDLLRDIHDL